jgi:hypothetical protein
VRERGHVGARIPISSASLSYRIRLITYHFTHRRKIRKPRHHSRGSSVPASGRGSLHIRRRRKNYRTHPGALPAASPYATRARVQGMREKHSQRQPERRSALRMVRPLTGPSAKLQSAMRSVRCLGRRTPLRPLAWSSDGWSRETVYLRAWTLVACSRSSPGPSTESVRLAVAPPRTRRRRLRE